MYDRNIYFKFFIILHVHLADVDKVETNSITPHSLVTQHATSALKSIIRHSLEPVKSISSSHNIYPSLTDPSPSVTSSLL
jgi:hypothetical protein